MISNSINQVYICQCLEFKLSSSHLVVKSLSLMYNLDIIRCSTEYFVFISKFRNINFYNRLVIFIFVNILLLYFLKGLISLIYIIPRLFKFSHTTS